MQLDNRLEQRASAAQRILITRGAETRDQRVAEFVVDSIDKNAETFYKHFGFSAIKAGETRLCLLISELASLA